MAKKLDILLLTALFALPLSAQNLHKDIEVERRITPERRDAARIGVYPTLDIQQPSRQLLNFSDRMVSTLVPNNITTLSPAETALPLFGSPYRGYASLSLGAPLLDLGLSAGYRAVATKKTTLDVFLQYNGDIYKRKLYSLNPIYRDHTAFAGVSLRHAIGRGGQLAVNGGYGYAYHNMAPYSAATGLYGQNMSRFGLEASFDRTADGDLGYKAAVRGRHFGFYHLAGAPAAFKGARQNLFGATLGAALPFNDNDSYIGLDIDANFLHTSEGLHQDSHGIMAYRSGFTRAIMTFTPSYRYGGDTFKATLGADLDVSVNDGKVFHVSPEVKFVYTPSQLLAMEASATGGSYLNANETLYDSRTPYLYSAISYSQSHVPVDVNLHVTLGPVFGVSIEGYGNFAKTRGWLMPEVIDGLPFGTAFGRVNATAYRGGVAVNYEYKKYGHLRVSYEGAPGKYDKFWYENADRASHIVNVALQVTPVDRLEVDLGWTFRSGRRSYLRTYDPAATGGFSVPVLTPFSLGSVSDLSVGASYRVTDPLTVFVKGENLLSRRYLHVGNRVAQGIHASVGAAYKF